MWVITRKQVVSLIADKYLLLLLGGFNRLACLCTFRLFLFFLETQAGFAFSFISFVDNHLVCTLFIYQNINIGAVEKLFRSVERTPFLNRLNHVLVVIKKFLFHVPFFTWLMAFLFRRYQPLEVTCTDCCVCIFYWASMRQAWAAANYASATWLFWSPARPPSLEQMKGREFAQRSRFFNLWLNWDELCDEFRVV